MSLNVYQTLWSLTQRLSFSEGGELKDWAYFLRKPQEALLYGETRTNLPSLRWSSLLCYWILSICKFICPYEWYACQGFWIAENINMLMRAGRPREMICEIGTAEANPASKMFCFQIGMNIGNDYTSISDTRSSNMHLTSWRYGWRRHESGTGFAFVNWKVIERQNAAQRLTESQNSRREFPRSA